MFVIITSMKHLPALTCSNVPGAQQLLPATPPCSRWSSSPSLSPHLKISKYCPHQSLEFSWQRGKWGRRGWLGSGIIIQIPPSKEKRWGREIMASLCGGRRQREVGGRSLTPGAQAVFREADGAWWQLTEGAACLSKERKASLQAGPLHAWLTATEFTLSPCTGPTFLLRPLVWVARMNHASRVKSSVLGLTHTAPHLCRLLHFPLWSSLPAPLNQGISGGLRNTPLHKARQAALMHLKLSLQMTVQKLNKMPCRPLFFCNQVSGKEALEGVSVTKSLWLKSKMKSCYG